MSKHFSIRKRRNNRGQSFVELALVVLILALMLAGVVEFGFLLNQYLKVLDSTREAARYAGSGVAFEWDDSSGTYVSRQDFYEAVTLEAINIMSSTIQLNGNVGDNIVISVFTVGGPSSPTIVRWPLGEAFGWNLCENSTDTNIMTPAEHAARWNSCGAWVVNTRSKFTEAQVLNRMIAGAPGAGVVLVEVFYNYPQLLKLPVFEQMIPDPILVYAYSFMPLASAQPTPGP